MSTWNPSDKNAIIALSNGYLTATNTTTASWGGVRANISKSSGKWYWEIRKDAETSSHAIGIGTSGHSLSTGVGYNTPSGYGYWHSGSKFHNNAGAAFGDSFAVGDIVGVAIDLTAGKIWWAKNNVWQNSGDPAAGTNEAFSGISGTFFPIYSTKNQDAAGTARFSSADQTYAAPAGFFALESAINLLDGKIRIKSDATNLLDGSLAISPGTYFLDGKIKIKDETTNLLDGKVKIRNSATNLLDGKVKVRDSATNLFDGRMWVVYTGQIGATCPTPTCEMAATFRYARLQAEVPVPTAGFRTGKRIEGDLSVPVLTCTAYHGRNPSLIASAPYLTCSMRVGISLGNEVGMPAPTCVMVADTHHLVTLYGNVPSPTCEIIADTKNIAIISTTVPCPRGLFATTVGNVADIYGRVSVPTCSMGAITGIVVNLRGGVPTPGDLVRFYASPVNVSITLGGDVPVPTMLSLIRCSLPSLILRHERGKIR
ncbi:MAG: hypothetical protein BA863_12330 [Desulfovibrio sp. S3730MH75]|nr:MAG: hypothetical protein BA863_12330 [Desulfovibrio sp. S3730MH75]